MPMVAYSGLEKFSHLEDKIYRTIELTKTLRQEKDDLERQLATVRGLGGDKQQLIAQIERLLGEREVVRTKVQGMLDAVIAADPELAEAIREAVPPSYRHGRIHPATKTFQALRIAVNGELEAIRALGDAGILFVVATRKLRQKLA